MKRTANLLVIAALSSVYGTALAAASPTFPEGAQEFPPIQASGTYMDRHSESVKTQRSVPGPSSAPMFDPIQSQDTYMTHHANDIETQRSIMYPSSARD
jgi:hypothetical protein